MMVQEKIVALCNEICLQYQRGCSSEELIERCCMVTGKVEGITLQDFQDLEEEFFTQPIKLDVEENIESCGVRMYSVLRSMFAEDRKTETDIVILRLFAVRCMDLGLSRADKSLSSVRKSLTEVMRCYYRTALKLAELAQPNLLKKALAWNDDVLELAQAIKFIRAEYGMSQIGDQFATCVFEAAKMLSEHELESLKSNVQDKMEAEEIARRTLSRWSKAMDAMIYTCAQVQLQVVDLLRSFFLALYSVHTNYELALEYFHVVNEFRDRVRRRGVWTKQEQQKELDDLVTAAEIYVQLGNQAFACRKLDEVDEIRGNAKVEEISRMSGFKANVVRFHLKMAEAMEYKATASVDDAYAVQYEKAIDHALNLLRESTLQMQMQLENEDFTCAFLLLVDCCKLFCRKVGFSENNVKSTFLELDSAFAKKDRAALCTMRIELLKLLQEETSSQASFGCVVEKLIQSKQDVSEGGHCEELQNILWNRVCKDREHENYNGALVTCEYLSEFLDEHEEADKAVRNKLGLAIPYCLLRLNETCSEKEAKLRLLDRARKSLSTDQALLAAVFEFRILIREYTLGVAQALGDLERTVESMVRLAEPESIGILLDCARDAKSVQMVEPAIKMLQGVLDQKPNDGDVVLRTVHELVLLRLDQCSEGATDLIFEQSRPLSNVDESFGLANQILASLDQIDGVKHSGLGEQAKICGTWLECCCWNLASKLLLYEQTNAQSLNIAAALYQKCVKLCEICYDGEEKMERGQLAQESYLGCIVDWVMFELLHKRMLSTDAIVVGNGKAQHQGTWFEIRKALEEANGESYKFDSGEANLSPIITSTRLLHQLVNAYEDDSISIQNYSLSLDVHSLEEDMLAELGVICKAFGASQCAALLLQVALQKQLAKDDPKLNVIASILTELVELCLVTDAKALEDWIQQLIQIECVFEEADRQDTFPVREYEYMASITWNMGVDLVRSSKDNPNDREKALRYLYRAVNMFESCGRYSKPLRDKHEALQARLETWKTGSES